MITLPAPAKLNLYLHVTGRRADGYHTLDSLVVFLAAGDRLQLIASDSYSLSLNGAFAAPLAGEPAQNNLITKAVRAVSNQLGRPPHLAVTLTKNLPIASGIGGGSADAAAAIRGALQLWQTSLPADEPMAIAAKLGADVPACLWSRPLFMAGIGELLTPAPPPPTLHMVLANAGVVVPTPAVFAAYQAAGSAFSPSARPATLPTEGQAFMRWLASTRNDLTAAAITVCPPIAEVLAALKQSGATLARMAGSGGTCFGLYPSAAMASTAAALLASQQPKWWVVATHSLDNPPPAQAA
jgi:4-diphosphocytidyl-2-C-methyl-D-erythritol kinase